VTQSASATPLDKARVQADAKDWIIVDAKNDRNMSSPERDDGYITTK
jgi:hypothetical protein